MLLTVNQAAVKIHEEFGGELVAEWRMRRVFDSIDDKRRFKLIKRINNVRLIDEKKLPIVVSELRELGLLPAIAS